MVASDVVAACTWLGFGEQGRLGLGLVASEVCAACTWLGFGGQGWG